MQDNCFLDFIDPELYSHSTKMSQGRNDDKKSLQDFTKAIAGKICELGSEKTQSLFSSACIYKVPEGLRKLNKSAYTPRVIAIGPLHWKDKHLQESMQRVKWYYTHHLLERLTKGIEYENEKKKKLSEVLQQCAEKMKEKKCVDEAKKYYATEVMVDDEKMSEMMLVDGCFVLELLYASHSDKKSKEAGKMTTNGVDSGINLKASCSAPQPNGGEDSSKSSAGGQKRKADPILNNLLTYNNVKHDLLLLENQIPFFVLEELFKLTVEQIHGNHIMGCTCKLSLSDYVLSYFHEIMGPEGENSGRATTTCCSPRDTILWVYNKITCTKTEVEQEEKVSEKPKEYYHILHLLHSKYSPVDQKKLCGIEQSSTKFSKLSLPAASDLEYAGVKFVPGKGTNLFNVKFKEDKGITWWCHRAEFEIPTLGIHDPTEPFLRNLIAFEQCCPEVSWYFTSYAKLMDMLINSDKDVEVLKKAEVIHNYLGADEDVSGLFNKLCKEVVLGEFYFNGECEKASEYSGRRWPQFMAFWIRTYFASPWAFIGFSVAFAAFVMQVTSFVRDFLK